MGLLDGKTGLILNIANDRSIAAHIATHCIKEGATCGFGYLPMGDSTKSERRVRKAMEEGGYGDAWLHACDVSSDASIETFFAEAGRKFGKIDFLVHSLAYANKDYLKKEDGVFTSTPRDVFAQALDISAYSLIALTREAARLMPTGGSVICLSYLGGEKVVPGYNVMGVAKAALESTARYLAFDLGAKNIRVNTISAGPVKTLSAMAVGGIDDMFNHVARKASMRRNIEGEEVGKAALFLLSDLASGVSGETLYVDAGFFAVGI
jgi:enoyl-[acyl-carrier protein] reductase I